MSFLYIKNNTGRLIKVLPPKELKGIEIVEQEVDYHISARDGDSCNALIIFEDNDRRIYKEMYISKLKLDQRIKVIINILETHTTSLYHG